MKLNKGNIKDLWIGYFVCPVCGKELKIDGWKLKEGEDVTIKFVAGKNKGDIHKMKFWCDNCNSTWEFGIKQDKN